MRYDERVENKKEVRTMKEYEIGTKFIRKQGKVKRVETIIDVYKTYNSKNELVSIEYITTNEFMGQLVKGSCSGTTILLGEIVQ